MSWLVPMTLFGATTLVATIAMYFHVTSSAMARDFFRRVGIFDVRRNGVLEVTRHPATYRKEESFGLHLNVEGQTVTINLTRRDADDVAQRLSRATQSNTTDGSNG